MVDKLSGEPVARLFGEGWDKFDAASRENQKTQDVQQLVAGKGFQKTVADKQDYLETKWAAAAQVRDLKNPKAVLAEFRTEIAKMK